MSSNVEVRVPDIGGAAGVKVIEVLVAVGDTVEKEQSLVTLESEKATMDVPSSAAGRVVAVHVTPGAEAAEGTLVVTLEASGGAGVDASREQARSHTANAPAPAASPATATSPAVTSSPVMAASLLATPAAVATPAPVVGPSEGGFR